MDARKWKKDPIDCDQVQEYSEASSIQTPHYFFFSFSLSSHSDFQSSISVDSPGDVRAVSGGLSSSPMRRRRCLLDLNAVTCAEDDFRGGIWD
ncbi:hypothetical protein TNIN_67651 [Trichonephila inaurata madagascariensis]|uniref:Uncharacterized protein n=1 Tax=Trichonephila inaurata madagascariensis TaxID=2747483 RepID=A0A8X6J8B2_9ARAC|nr:hypothetical protein TNIN_67651 [Trichonephila inaurata madagascariensis]